MEILQQAFGGAVTAFIAPWIMGLAVLGPFALFILAARKFQANKEKELLKEFDR